MSKVSFLPVSIGGGLLAGLIGEEVFSLIWGVIDDQEAPHPGHRDIHLGKLALALTIEAALFSLVKGFVDHGSRHAFTRLTGSWPGDEAPENPVTRARFADHLMTIIAITPAPAPSASHARKRAARSMVIAND